MSNSRTYIAYDIRGVTDSNDATVLEAMGDYADRSQVLQELLQENFINLYGPYVVYSYNINGRTLSDEQIEFVDYGDNTKEINDLKTGNRHQR